MVDRTSIRAQLTARAPTDRVRPGGTQQRGDGLGLLGGLEIVEVPRLDDGEAVEVGGRVVAERGLAAYDEAHIRMAWLRWAHAPGSALHGEITWIGVHPDRQRCGLARAMAVAAKGVEPALHHSMSVTPDGEAWRSAVGDI
jgi:ribosomal protein S18 acetylase RimI-like enzyme